MKYGCALLAGGRGSRMGEVNKAKLNYKDQTFAGRISGEMNKTGMPCYLSSAVYDQELPEGWKQIKDDITDSDGSFIGPMGGIYSCLKQAEADGLDGLFFAPCDAPFYQSDIIEKLVPLIDENTEAAVWRTSDGRMQTAYGWYSVKMLPILEKDIRNGHYKLLKAIEKCRLVTDDACKYGLDEISFSNINTRDDYLLLV